MYLSFIVLELTLLYFLSRRLTQNLYIALFLLTKSRSISVNFLSLLFFPGTVIHELSHLFTAEILGVRTAGLTLVPEGIEKTQVRTGSVSIVQTDPLRRAVIGVAPVFVGLGTLFTISYFLPHVWEQAMLDLANGIAFSNYSIYLLGFLFYSLFAVSNSMFSSPEDMDGFWPVAIVVALVLGATYIAGIRISIPDTLAPGVNKFMVSLVTNIGGVVGLNVVLFGVSKLMIYLVQRLTGRVFIAKK